MIWFILLYVLPIIIIAMAVYVDMEKGQTVEDYLSKDDKEWYALIMFVPGINIVTAFIGLCLIFYNLVKDFKK
jgi:hypothetical protein